MLHLNCKPILQDWQVNAHGTSEHLGAHPINQILENWGSDLSFVEETNSDHGKAS